MLHKKLSKFKDGKKSKAMTDMILPFPPPMSNDNTIESDSHTLISVDVPSEMSPMINNEGHIIEGIFQQTPSMVLHKLFLADFDDESKHGIHKIINKLQEADTTDHLEMHISGHGGYISEGLMFFNVINSMFNSRCTAYLTYGYSMNALAFLFANERIVYEHSEIMFHTYSAGFGGKRDDILSQIAHTDKHLQKFFYNTLTPYFSDDEINSMGSSKDYWLNSHEMLVRGIATGIIIDGVYFTSEEYFEKHDKKGKVRKKWVKAQEKLKAEAEALLAQVMEGVEDGES